MSWLLPGFDLDSMRNIRDILCATFPAIICEPFYICYDTMRMTSHTIKFLAFFIKRSSRRLFTRRWTFEKALCVIAVLDIFINRQYCTFMPQGNLLRSTYRWAFYSWRVYAAYNYLHFFSTVQRLHFMYMCCLAHCEH